MVAKATGVHEQGKKEPHGTVRTDELCQILLLVAQGDTSHSCLPSPLGRGGCKVKSAEMNQLLLLRARYLSKYSLA